MAVLGLAGAAIVPQASAGCVYGPPSNPAIKPLECPETVDIVWWHAFGYVPWAIECVGWQLQGGSTPILGDCHEPAP